MFLWPSQPKCPVNEPTQAWVNGRMKWLAGQFGMQTWRTTRVIEPTSEFFPETYEKNEASVQRMLRQVCDFMVVHPSRVELKLYSERRPQFIEKSAGTAGLYSGGAKEIVGVEVSNLADPMALVATLAHEVAHARLLGEKRISAQEEDHEPLTDLATVFFGMGIFNANSTFRYGQWTTGQWSGWKAKSMGYLNETVFGYALGLWAHVRGERNPRWMKHLVLNPRTFMKQTLRYLEAHPPEGF